MNFSFKIARARHLRIGRRGENIACSYLKNRNMAILAKNYKCTQGEIDLVARDGKILSFVEVKTRRSTSKGRPVEGLTEKQKNRIYNAARHYISEIGSPGVIFRFDLIEIVLHPWGPIRELRYWPRHFSKPAKQRKKELELK